MKAFAWKLLFCLLVFLPGRLHAEIQLVATDPTGTCTAPTYTAVNATTGQFSNCIASTWTKVKASIGANTASVVQVDPAGPCSYPPLGFVAVNALTGAITTCQMGQWTTGPASVTPTPTPSTGQFAFANDFDFAAQKPGGSLVPGSNAIALTPVPRGVNGTDTGHYLYVSGGAGTSEPCLIVGGSGTSGQTTGQIIVSCGGSHSGNWTIKSASTGLEEALVFVAAAGGGAVGLPAGVTRVYQVVTIPNNRAMQIFGTGTDWANSRIFRDSSYPAGDILYAQPASSLAALRLNNFGIINADGTFENTSGYAVHVKGGFYAGAVLDDIWVEAGFGGLWVDASGVKLQNFSYLQPNYYHFSSRAGMYISGHSLVVVNGSAFVSSLGVDGVGADGGLRLSYGLLAEGCDGCQFVNSTFSAKVGTSLVGLGATTVDDLYFDNCVWDGNTVSSFYTSGTNSPFVFTNIRVSNSHLNGVAASPIGNDLVGIAGDVDYVQFANNNLNLGAGSGIVVQGGNNYLGVPKTSLVITGNDISENNGANVGNQQGISLLTGASGLTITGNRIQNRSASGHQEYGISTADTLSNSIIQGNDLRGNEIGPLHLGGALTNTIIRDNVGIDDVIGTVASATSITLPINPIFSLTGSATITTIVGAYIGQTMDIVPTGAPVFVASATIGNTITGSPGVPITGVVQSDGKLYLNAGGGGGGGGAVSSVFGRIGAIVAAAADYAASQVTNAYDVTTANVISAGLQDFSNADILLPVNAADPGTCQAGQIEFNSVSTTAKICASTNTWVTIGNNLVTSVFGRVGIVTAQTGDYTAAQVTNAFNLATANTVATGLQDFSSADFRVPARAGAVSTVLNSLVRDTTTSLLHSWISSSDSIVLWSPIVTAPVVGNCANFGANFSVLDAGAPCGSGGGGAAFQVDGTPLISSATVNFQDSAATNGDTVTFTNPSAGNIRLGISGIRTVPGGGTGQSTLTNHGVLIGRAGAAIAATAAGSLDTVLQGAGAGADPTYVPLLSCGDATHALSYSTSSHAWGCQLIASGGTITGSGLAAQGMFWSAPTVATGSANWTYSASSGHSLTQGANNTDAYFIKRFTDTSPTGNFLHFQNAVLSSDMFKVDVSGNVTAAGFFSSGSISQTCGTGVVGCAVFSEGSTASTGAAAYDMLRADSTKHWLLINPNNAGEEPLAGINGAVVAGHLVKILNGNEITDGGAIPASAFFAGTNSSAQIINNQPFAVNPRTTTYTATVTDFQACKTITVSSGTFTLTLVATGTQPASGQCLWILNYGSGAITLARNGQNINGGTTSLTVPAATATAPTGAFVTSNGVDYFAFLFGASTGGGGAPYITWSTVTGTTQVASTNNGYIANNASQVVVTIPATCTVGDTFAVIGQGAGGWKIAQAASQVIHFGNRDSTTGTSGYLQSTLQYDNVHMICIATNTDFAVVSSVGNLTIN